MRILYITSYWDEPHRWSSSAVKLAGQWCRLGCKVTVLCMCNVENGKYEEVSFANSLTVCKVQDWFLPDPWNYGVALSFFRIASLKVEEVQPDAIVVDKVLYWTSIATIFLTLKGRQVLVVTDALVGITWWTKGWLFNTCAFLYANTLGWLILGFARKVVFFHPQPDRVLQRLGIARKSTVIPSGIDVSAYYSEKSRDLVTLAYVGRLESVKRVDDFLAVASALSSEGLRVIVVGPYAADDELFMKYKDTVEFLGLRRDIEDIYAEIDVLVLPSYCEGLSNTLMEAMASSCACVASDVGGNPYLIEHGVSGFVYPSGDRRLLRFHVQRLLDDRSLRQRVGAAARRRMEECYDWSVVGPAFLEQLSKVSANA